METFLRFYESIRDTYGFNLEIYNSSITNWCITVGYKITMGKGEEVVIEIQDSDVDFAFAKAQVALKEWLLKNNGGY